MTGYDIGDGPAGGGASDSDLWAALVAVDAVDPEDEHVVRELRERDPLFDDRVERYRRDAADLAASAAAEPPPELRGSVLDAVAERPPAAEPAAVTPIGSGRRGPAGAGAADRGRIWSWGLATAAAVVVAIGGGIAWLSMSDRGSDGADAGSVVAGPSAAPSTMVEKADVAGGEVTVERVEGHSDAVVRLTGVPAPEAGTAYQMWLVARGSSRSVGVMGPEDVTDDMTVKIDGVDAADSLMISVEPTGGSTAPTRALVEIPLER